jgi:Tetracyclin repressor-like, C-terminal domain
VFSGVGVDLVEVEAPGYAGRLVRLHERRPEIMRLCTWQRLERTDGEPNPAGVAYARAQIDAIAQAQKTGDLPTGLERPFGRKSLAKTMITKDFRAIRTKSLRGNKSIRDHGDALRRWL